MAELLFSEQKLTGFEYAPDYNCYITIIDPQLFSLVVGETYTVVWDGIVNVYKAQDISVLIDDAVFIGNLSTFEPCAVCYTPNMILVGTNNPSTDPHTIAVYRGEISSSNVALYDHGGNLNFYDIGKGIRLLKADGGVQDFFPGNPEELTVDLDFAKGDIVIDAPGITVYEKVSIPKPSNLIPENIAEGVEIAGVIGNLVSGGGLQLEGDFLKYAVYQLDEENKEIIIYGILWSRLYEITGSYDLNIPSRLGEYQIVLASEGVN